MKVLPFTIPVTPDKTVIIQRDILPYFYPHLHRHQEIQLTWVQKGEGTLVAENNMHTFWSNEIYWIGANQPHVFKSDPVYFIPKSKKKIYSLTIFFNPNGKLAPLFEFPEMKNIKSFVGNYQCGFKVPAQMVTEISNRMVRIQNATGADQLLQFLDLLKTLANTEQLPALTSNTKQQSFTDFEGMRIGSIYNYIMQHYENPLTLEAVAMQAHMTPQAFCRYFKKHTRHTFISFLNQVRINEACKKLTDGSYDSVSTVAYNCGFNSITNFNRVFKSVTGKSPRDYIRDYIDKVDY